MKKSVTNAKVLEDELNWLACVLDRQLKCYFDPKKHVDLPEIPPPNISNSDSWYSSIINENGFNSAERIVLALALAPEMRPQLLDILFTNNKQLDRGFTEFGGIIGKRHSGFLPTIQTAQFLLAQENIATQIELTGMFAHNHAFCKSGMLDFDNDDGTEPASSLPLRLARDFWVYLTQGRSNEPEYSPDFPAQRLTTLMNWEDLVLAQSTWGQLEELLAWLEHGKELLNNWQVGKHIVPGYRVLFYGPPGTGKTITANLLGKKTGRPVFRVDLSQLVSKYIGETEKNLERVFRQAEKKDWLLFFDEADALFGKRTQISSSNDRFANQSTAYLLQRLEVCSNVVILASNLKSNFDDAYTRRFQSIVYFPMPSRRERKELWKRTFSPVAELANDVDIDSISNEYELAGGAIVNVVRYCSLMAIRRGEKVVRLQDLKNGLIREYGKEGRTL